MKFHTKFFHTGMAFGLTILLSITSGCKTVEPVDTSVEQPDIAKIRNMKSYQIFVRPVHVGTNEGEIYERTVELIKALRSEGFNAYANDPGLTIQSENPHLIISATATDPLYCLQGVVTGMQFPMDQDISFEHRQRRIEGVLTLSNAQCAQYFVKKLSVSLH